MKTHAIVIVLAAVILLCVRVPVRAQSFPDLGGSSGIAASTTTDPEAFYTPPTDKVWFHNYLTDTFGPFTLLSVGFAAGVDQATDSPSEWKQGAPAYGWRLASEFGISTVSTTTNYGLSEALRQDPLYYPCQRKGLFPRLSHAVISSFTERRGEDGHEVFSIPGLAAPYAASMTAVYGWYPRHRYGFRDGLRLGNYYLLGNVAGNIAKEFLSGGAHSWLSRLHLTKAHGTPSSDSQPSRPED